MLKILRTLQSSSLLVTSYRRQRDPKNNGNSIDLSEQKSCKTIETPTSTDPKEKFGRQDTYFGTFFPDKV